MIAQTLFERIAENKALMEALYLVIGAIIITLGMAIKEKIKKIINSDSTSVENMVHTQKSADKIAGILTQLVGQFKCNVAFYSLLHNGDSYSSGEGIKKVTRVNQKIPEDQPPIPNYSTTVHLNGMPDFIREMVRAIDGPVVIKTSDLQNGMWKNELLVRGVKLMIIRSLTRDKLLLGIIGLEWTPVGDSDKYLNDVVQGFNLELFNAQADLCQAIASRKDLPWYKRIL